MKRRENNRYISGGLLFFWLFIIAGQIMAQNASVFSLVSSSPDHVVVRFTGEKFHFQNQRTSRGQAQVIATGQGVQGLTAKAPMLPHYAVSLSLPKGAKMVVKVISAHYYEVKNMLVAPSRGNVYRGIRQDSLPFVFGKVYDSDTFYPDRLWVAGSVYELRQKTGQALRLFPFRYNPQEKILRVYDKIVLDIVFKNDRKNSSVTQQPFPATIFDQVCGQQFINNSFSLKSIRKQSLPPGMLIISYGPFIPLLKNFIQWKRKTGMSVRVADVASIGKTARQIKAYVKKVYENTGVAYLLLVGDAGQVPPGSVAGNASDNDYAYVAGNDHYPDLFVGRFSADDSVELSTMLHRTLAYEKDTLSCTASFTRAVGIGSEMGTGYHDLTDYQQIRFIDSAYLLASTYRQATELFDGSQGGFDAAGDPTADMLTDALEKGAGIINYCGHGSTTGWNTTHFDNDKVDHLRNVGRWPFIISVSCATGNFVHQDCFAEHWLWAAYNGKPAGAVAVLMPTVAQSWDPPMCGQQQMNALLVAPGSVHPPRTFAAICMAGCMKMNDEYGTDGYEVTDTWTVFGDPSLVVRTAVPQQIIADFPSSVDDTCSSILVKTNLRGGRVALYSRGIIYAVSAVDSMGIARLPVDSVPAGRHAGLTITAFNHHPFSGTISWERNSSVAVNRENYPALKVFPNPAREKVTLSFVLKKNSPVEISVFNPEGKKIETLLRKGLSSGRHRFLWHPAVQGIYFLQLKTGEMRVVKKMIILK